MDPRKLLYLATVIEQGSLIGAARLLAISQPALSKSMDRLEAELGQRLLDRSASGVTPTAAGELLYTHARQLREELVLAEKRVRQTGRLPERVVRLGTLPSLASSVVPLAASRWRLEHPGVGLQVAEDVQSELLLGLLRHQFDFVVAQTEFYDFWDGLKQRVLFRDRMQVFARARHPLALAASLSWADLAGFPWVCPLVGGAHRTLLERILATEGLSPPAQLIECGSVDFTRSLILASDHLAMLPAHSMMAESGAGTVLPLSISVPALRRDIALIFRDGTALDAPGLDLVRHVRTIGRHLAGDSRGDQASSRED
jgi:LysR family transcriptional regulator of gallate degradation